MWGSLDAVTMLVAATMSSKRLTPEERVERQARNQVDECACGVRTQSGAPMQKVEGQPICQSCVRKRKRRAK